MENFIAIFKRVLETVVIGTLLSEAQAIADTAMILIIPFLRSLTGV